MCPFAYLLVLHGLGELCDDIVLLEGEDSQPLHDGSHAVGSAALLCHLQMIKKNYC